MTNDEVIQELVDRLKKDNIDPTPLPNATMPSLFPKALQVYITKVSGTIYSPGTYHHKMSMYLNDYIDETKADVDELEQNIATRGGLAAYYEQDQKKNPMMSIEDIHAAHVEMTKMESRAITVGSLGCAYVVVCDPFSETVYDYNLDSAHQYNVVSNYRYLRGQHDAGKPLWQYLGFSRPLT